jgi:hypothetical protein
MPNGTLNGIFASEGTSIRDVKCCWRKLHFLYISSIDGLFYASFFSFTMDPDESFFLRFPIEAIDDHKGVSRGRAVKYNRNYFRCAVLSSRWISFPCSYLGFHFLSILYMRT